MKLWAKVYHRARVFSVGKFAVFGVKFRDFGRLGSVQDEIHYRLPKDLSVSIEMTDKRSGTRVKLKAVLMGNLAGLPPHDAFFRIVSESLEYFGVGVEVAVQRTPEFFDIKIDPKYNSATYSAQLSTIGQLQVRRPSPSHQVAHVPLQLAQRPR